MDNRIGYIDAIDYANSAATRYRNTMYSVADHIIGYGAGRTLGINAATFEFTTLTTTSEFFDATNNPIFYD